MSQFSYNFALSVTLLINLNLQLTILLTLNAVYPPVHSTHQALALVCDNLCSLFNPILPKPSYYHDILYHQFFQHCLSVQIPMFFLRLFQSSLHAFRNLTMMRFSYAGKKHVIVTRSKTGSLQPRTFNMDDLKRRSTAIMSKAELEKLQSERKDSPEAESGSRLTRLKAQQIASGIGSLS